MATVLEIYRKKQEEIQNKILAKELPVEDVMIMQELNYRICVIETFQNFSKTAPITSDTHEISYHYNVLKGYTKLIRNERKFGIVPDEKAKKRVETSRDLLNKVIEEGQKTFTKFDISKPDLYKKSISEDIKTILPVWMQYRDAYLLIDTSK